jgi:sarcosine oxidase subunit beta
MEQLTCDVAIIGGGIVGGSAALALRKMGYSVVLLERRWCGAEASGVNYGGVRRQGRSQEQLPLAQRAHGIWPRLKDLIGIDGEYVRSGHMKLARSEVDLASLEAYAKMAEPFGLGLEILTGNRFRDRFPGLGDSAIGGSLCPEDGHANPRLVSAAFARAAAREGADVRENTEVLGAHHNGVDFQIAAADLTVCSKFLLNCAGAWAGQFAASFGELVPMQRIHPNMLVTEPVAPFMDVNIGVEGGGVYGRQVSRGNVVLGGGRGIAVGTDLTRPAYDATLRLMAQVVELFPQVRHAQVIRTWTGIEGDIPDHNPVIGFSGTTPNLLHAFGFCGAGFQTGPAVGEVLAELVRDGTTEIPIEAFDIGRFARRLSRASVMG